MSSAGRWFWLIGFLFLLASGCLRAQEVNAPVAVFEEERFPCERTPEEATPARIRSVLTSSGIHADAVGAQALADPERFNARRYRVLVWVNGSVFPKAAAENLRRFHAMGGCLVSTGVPFSNPADIPETAGVPRWTAVAPGKSAVRVEGRNARSGRFAAAVRKDGGDWAGLISSRVACEPGRLYRLSAWLRAAHLSGTADRLSLRFYGIAGQCIEQSDIPLPDSDQWVKTTREIRAPADAEAMAVCLQVATPQVTARLDDVSLLPADSPPDQADSWIPDAGFELFARAGWRDTGYTPAYGGHDQIGAGSARTVYDCTSYAPRGRDPLSLKFLKWAKPTRAHAVELLDPKSLPKEDEVIGLVSAYQGQQAAGFPAALIRHNCPQFKGAADVWVGSHNGSLLASPRAEQIILAATAYLLLERKLLSRPGYDRILRLAQTATAPKPEAKRPAVSPAPSPTVYPRAQAPARELLLASVAHQPLSVRLMTAALQGLANRQQPRIYIEDEWWPGLAELGYKGVPIGDPYELVSRFRSDIQGLVIYDPDFPATVNIAVTLSALNRSLPVSPDLADKLVRRFQLKPADDLRGRWKNDAEAYRWALQNLLPRCNQRLLAHQKQAEPLAPESVGPASAAVAVDYLVQQKIFSFHLNRVPTPAELDAADDILAALPPNIPVMGRMGPHPTLDPDTLSEWELISRLSGFGKFFLYGIPANLSVHSGIPLEEKLSRKPVRKLTPDKTKVYVSFLCSEGDSLWFWYGMRSRANGWGNPGRGKAPIAWGITPALLDLAPAILSYHYRTASALDSFFAPVSGIGFIYPELYGIRYQNAKELFDDYLKLTAEAMKRMDLHIVRPHQAGGTGVPAYSRYAQAIESLLALFPDYGRRPNMTLAKANYRLDSGIPVFHCLTASGSGTRPNPAQAAEQIAHEIRTVAGKTRPAFIHAILWGWVGSPEDVRAVSEKLGPDYILVNPEEMVTLFGAN
ncbi:MAG: hypothetical protein IT210_21320 [Armatimonadetes bacterium]|nr:hypothetical protein [Armatimonadota bacterium]